LRELKDRKGNIGDFLKSNNLDYSPVKNININNHKKKNKHKTKTKQNKTKTKQNKTNKQT